jgi:hypothetical protein
LSDYALHCFVLAALAQPARIHDQRSGSRATHARLAVDEQSAAFGLKLLGQFNYLSHVFHRCAFFCDDVSDPQAQFALGVVVTLRKWIVAVTDRYEVGDFGAARRRAEDLAGFDPAYDFNADSGRAHKKEVYDILIIGNNRLNNA